MAPSVARLSALRARGIRCTRCAHRVPAPRAGASCWILTLLPTSAAPQCVKLYMYAWRPGHKCTHTFASRRCPPHARRAPAPACLGGQQGCTSARQAGVRQCTRGFHGGIWWHLVASEGTATLRPLPWRSQFAQDTSCTFYLRTTCASFLHNAYLTPAGAGHDLISELFTPFPPFPRDTELSAPSMAFHWLRVI